MKKDLSTKKFENFGDFHFRLINDNTYFNNESLQLYKLNKKNYSKKKEIEKIYKIQTTGIKKQEHRKKELKKFLKNRKNS